MSDLIIQANSISKRYQLGTIGSNSLRRDIHAWWQKRFNKSNTLPLSMEQQLWKNELWALKDVNFEVKEGEAWGIIGRNGAGKSTLLKILSRITKPTEGTIKGRGKISSLLEIGTGFHPELTGRENIFICGNILGMKNHEIRSKLDEIIDFSGVEQFIDTPVKRYSSGMYVRLAFAVAAHLEPDILVVDEVLAVGDAEFQKKCMGKMKDESSKKGRTVIFVSHNLQAVNNLCSNALWLQNGKVADSGSAKSVINSYLNTMQQKSWKKSFSSIEEAPGNNFIKVMSVELVAGLSGESENIDIRTPVTVKFTFFNFTDDIELSVDLLLFTLSGECIFDIPSKEVSYKKGLIYGECTIPGNFLNNGSYYFSLYFVENTSKQLFTYEECLMFDVADYRENTNYYDKWWGYVRPNYPLILTPVLKEKN